MNHKRFYYRLWAALAVVMILAIMTAAGL